MKTLLILIGKTQNRDFDNGIIDYIKRINHYMPLEVEVKREVIRVQEQNRVKAHA